MAFGKTIFTMKEGQLLGGSTEAERSRFRAELEFLEGHAKQIGEILGMQQLTMAGMLSDSFSLLFHYVPQGLEGVTTEIGASIPMLAASLPERGNDDVVSDRGKIGAALEGAHGNGRLHPAS